MSRVSWFSEENDEAMFASYVERMESWQRAMADGVITDEEVRDQANQVTALLKEVEESLDDAQHEKVTTALLEWAVLQGMSTTLMLQATQQSQEATPDASTAP